MSTGSHTRRARALAVCALACALLCACFADLDWRQLTPAEGGFTVAMPGRVSEETRALDQRFGGALMRQWSTNARGALFAVARVEAGQGSEALETALRDALVRNISGRLEEERELVLGNTSGRESKAIGTNGGRTLRLHLRQYRKDAQLYQISVLGEPGGLSQDEIETFFGSFRFVDPGRAPR